MNNINSLKDLCQGQSATVCALRSAPGIRRRLQDIGLVEGTQVECLQKSPAGDPVAYRIRGAVIALRSEDAVDVLIN